MKLTRSQKSAIISEVKKSLTARGLAADTLEDVKKWADEYTAIQVLEQEVARRREELAHAALLKYGVELQDDQHYSMEELTEAFLEPSWSDLDSLVELTAIEASTAYEVIDRVVNTFKF